MIVRSMTCNTAIFFATFVWLSTALANTTVTTDTLKEENNWLNEAARLVTAAQGARTDATLFNKDVRESRANLRTIIQADRHNKLSPQHRQLHSTMLVMDVLLKSAAACQTAGHIVCPPMLMSQLKTVLANAYTNLDEAKTDSTKINVGVSP